MTNQYKLGKSVAVELERRGKPEAGEVGVNRDGTVFGYVSRGALSLMSYSLDSTFVPAEVIATTRERGGLFFFDFGNDFTISADELERAFRELRLL